MVDETRISSDTALLQWPNIPALAGMFTMLIDVT